MFFLIRRNKQAVLLWITAVAVSVPGCEVTRDAELAKAKAEAEAAKAELARLKSMPPALPAASMQARSGLSGELFVTLKNGDVKKAAGLQIRFIPVDDATRDAVREAKKVDDAGYTFIDNLSAKYPLWDSLHLPTEGQAGKQTAAAEREKAEFLKNHKPTLDAAIAKVIQRAQSTTTTSDGRFQISLEPGEYLLFSDQCEIGRDKLVWTKRVVVSGAETNISLDQKSAIRGLIIGEAVLPDATAMSVRTRAILDAASIELGAKNEAHQ
jgi:hypothetical protein